MVDNLRNDGALDNYISSKKSIINEIDVFLQSLQNTNVGNDAIHEITLKYDPNNLEYIHLSNRLLQNQEEKGHEGFSKFLVAQEGHIILSWKIGLQFIRNGYISMNECCLNEIMERIYALKYYEGHEV